MSRCSIVTLQLCVIVRVHPSRASTVYVRVHHEPSPPTRRDAFYSNLSTFRQRLAYFPGLFQVYVKAENAT